jgi:hypothetical protein
VATYHVFGVCNACGDLHTMGISISLPGAPINKQSLADAYPNKDPPPNIAALKDNRVQCHKSGRQYAQKDDKKIFLVPVT